MRHILGLLQLKFDLCTNQFDGIRYLMEFCFQIHRLHLIPELRLHLLHHQIHVIHVYLLHPLQQVLWEVVPIVQIKIQTQMIKGQLYFLSNFMIKLQRIVMNQ